MWCRSCERRGPGNAGGATHTYRLLSALTGDFDTVVLEVEMESLAAAEAFQGPLFSDPSFLQAQAQMAPLIESGRQEIYTIEDQG